MWARPNQLSPEGLWYVWLLLAGRGFGKTRTAAEWIRERVDSGVARFIALIGRSASDVRSVMVEGEAGILAVFPDHQKPIYEPSKKKITFHTGAIATTYTGEEPDGIRGPSFDTAWCDELAAWQYAQEAWDNLMMALRLGNDPRCVVSTTPRGIPIIKELKKGLIGKNDDPNKPRVGAVHITVGTTYENIENLAEPFKRIISKYEGTRLGRQELNAEVLEDTPGALWTQALIDHHRISREEALTLRFIRKTMAIDPAMGIKKDAKPGEDHSGETGINVAGIAPCMCKGRDRLPETHLFVIADLSGNYSAGDWAKAAYLGFDDYGLDRIYAEINNGGDLVEANIRSTERGRMLPFSTVWASDGKRTRAEPIAGLYEQGKVHHIGALPELEDQQTTWVPILGKSPDRLDALVWNATGLMIKSQLPAAQDASTIKGDRPRFSGVPSRSGGAVVLDPYTVAIEDDD